MQQKLSLCMIVRNEENTIVRCLDSVQDKVDEIIVVDTGSTDHTVDLLKKYPNINIKYYEWQDDFADARNFSIQGATMDYILILDADEYLDENVKIEEEIRSNLDYYIVNIKNYGSKGEEMTHEAIRCFKNGIGLEYTGKIHEHVNVGVNHTRGKINGTIHHLGYLDEIVASKEKSKRNLRLLLEEVKENPSGYNQYNLAKQYKIEGNHQEAVKLFQKAYQKSKGKQYLSNLLYHLADCLTELKRYDDALRIIQDSTNVYPRHTDLYYLKGIVLTHIEHYKEAASAFEKCLTLGDSKETISIDGAGSYLSHFALSKIYDQLGSYTEAFEQGYKALQLRNLNQEGLMHYLELLRRMKIPFEEIYQNLNSIYENKNEHNAFIIKVMAEVRYPLLLEYVNKLPNPIESSLKMISNLYAGYFEESKKYLMESKASKDIELDIGALSIVSREDLSRYISGEIPNLIIEILHSYLNGTPFHMLACDEEEEFLILTLFKRLLDLNDMDGANYVLDVLSQCSKQTKLRGANILVGYFHYDIALQLLESIEDNEAQRIKAEIYERKGERNLANQYLIKLSKTTSSYSVLIKLYENAEALGQTELAAKTKRRIVKKYPFSYLAGEAT